MLVPRSRDTPTYRAVVLFNSCTPCTVTNQPDIHQYRNGALRMVFVPMSCAVAKVWSSFYEHVNQAKRRIVTQCKCGCNKEVNGYFTGSNFFSVYNFISTNFPHDIAGKGVLSDLNGVLPVVFAVLELRLCRPYSCL